MGILAYRGHTCLSRAHWPIAGTLAYRGHTCLSRTHWPIAGTFAYRAHTGLSRAHLPIADTLAYRGHTCLSRTHLPIADTLAYRGHTCLSRAHWLTFEAEFHHNCKLTWHSYRPAYRRAYTCIIVLLLFFFVFFCLHKWNLLFDRRNGYYDNVPCFTRTQPTLFFNHAGHFHSRLLSTVFLFASFFNNVFYLYVASVACSIVYL